MKQNQDTIKKAKKELLGLFWGSREFKTIIKKGCKMKEIFQKVK